ncbi:MAG TPA: helicase-related protein, partial [Natrialbaceae archaeon]|nr:helicase-related protein [Natrialbaceae archaeon]
ARGDYDFHNDAADLSNDTLRQSVLDGVGFHHAGLSKSDKDRVEAWFKAGKIQLLFSTSTLAWGVNLPARCVVIRDTKLHDPLEGEVDMSPLDILQMLGRAGRPDYDDVGYGWVVCDAGEADKYRRLLRDGKPIESRLAEDLDAHLNAEIAMGTIRDLDDVMSWLETTFYYVRAQSAPAEYEFGSLRDRVRSVLDDLVDRGFVETGEDLSIEATALGRLASKYYLRLDTAAGFRDLATRDSIDEDAILRAVATAAEFDSVSARQSERDGITAVLGNRGDDLEPSARKVLAILRGGMSGTTPPDLQSDAWVIRQNALRLLAACRAFLERFADAHAANLARRIEARVENGVPAGAVGLTAIDGVGSGRASKLDAEGVSTPDDVRDADVEGLMAAGLSEGVSERVLESARNLPAVGIEWGAFPDSIPHGENDMREVRIRNGGDAASVGIRVTVNGREMTTRETYLADEETVPVGVFGADVDELAVRVSVAFPDRPLLPVAEERSVRVE